MTVNRDQARAFILGEELPTAVIVEIESTLDDPNSKVRRTARKIARLTKLALDPDGPPPGDKWRSIRG